MAAKYADDNHISLLGGEKPIGRVMLSKRTGDSIGERRNLSVACSFVAMLTAAPHPKVTNATTPSFLHRVS